MFRNRNFGESHEIKIKNTLRAAYKKDFGKNTRIGAHRLKNSAIAISRQCDEFSIFISDNVPFHFVTQQFSGQLHGIMGPIFFQKWHIPGIFTSEDAPPPRLCLSLS